MIFANNYRGFRSIDIDLSDTTFLVGDNSSGKSSILQLINYVIGSRLYGTPVLDGSAGVGSYDFFSPYFNYAPVTIGFQTNLANEARNTRILTINQNKNGPPHVKRALYSSENTCIVLKETPKHLFCKVEISDASFSLQEIQEIFASEKGFKKVDASALPNTSVNFPVTAYLAATSINPSNKKTQNISQALFSGENQSARHCAPIRAQPERFYSFERKYKASGAHFASMWHDLKEDHSSDLNTAIRKFGIASGLFDDVDVKPISSRIQESPLAILVKRNKKDFTLSQVGVGVSQVVPILVECIFGSFEDPKPLMLLQQPELHLHPVAQAAVGDFLFEMRLNKLISIVETHSDFLIDRYRARIRESTDEHAASIVYCHSDSEGNHMNSIKIASDGTLVEPPENYNQFFVNELMRTMF